MDAQSRIAEIRRENEAAERRTRCPVCGCTASSLRCVVPIGTDGDAGACVPRGTLGLKRCSGCLTR
jgi:hypothetical protein